MKQNLKVPLKRGLVSSLRGEASTGGGGGIPINPFDAYYSVVGSTVYAGVAAPAGNLFDVEYSTAGSSLYAGVNSPSGVTALETFIAAMAPNTWAEYTGTNINSTTVQPLNGWVLGILESATNYYLTNWANKWPWHPQRKLISGMGVAQGFISIANAGDYGKQIKFDLVSNAFSTVWNPANQANGYGHIYDANCSNFVNDKTWFKSYNDPCLIEYNAVTGTWYDSYDLTGLSLVDDIWSIECHPEHNALYCLEENTGRLVKFDLTTGVRTIIGTYTGIGSYPMSGAVGDYVVFGAGGGGTSLYKIDAAGVVTLVTNTLPVQYTVTGNFKLLAHPTSPIKMLGLSSTDAKLRELDIITGLFTEIGNLATEPALTASVGITLKGLGAVVMLRGAGRVSGTTNSKFWIYKV